MWRKKEEYLSYKCAKVAEKAMEKVIMVWGCLSAQGVGKIIILEGKVNADVYLKLLEPKEGDLLVLILFYNKTMRQFILQ